MTPDERQAFYAQVKGTALAPLWLREPTPEPRPIEVPHLWRWSDLQPLLMKSAQATGVSSTEAERRVLALHNPGLAAKGLVGATQTIGAAFQLLLPGETARAHRHSFHAFRFVLDGHGVSTVVNGQRVAMEPGDLVLTPGMCWHDHHHDGSEPMIWMDVLDSGVVHGLRGGFYEEHPSGESQPVTGELPELDPEFRVPGQAPPNVWRFPWRNAFEALQRVDSSDPTGFGAGIEYIDPRHGTSVLPTLGCYLHRIPARSHTRPRRETPSSVCHIVSGSGQMVVGDITFDFVARDIIAVPGWTHHEVRASDDEVVMFRVSDAPVFHKLGYFAEQTVNPGGSSC